MWLACGKDANLNVGRWHLVVAWKHGMTIGCGTIGCKFATWLSLQIKADFYLLFFRLKGFFCRPVTLVQITIEVRLAWKGISVLRSLSKPPPEQFRWVVSCRNKLLQEPVVVRFIMHRSENYWTGTILHFGRSAFAFKTNTLKLFSGLL